MADEDAAESTDAMEGRQLLNADPQHQDAVLSHYSKYLGERGDVLFCDRTARNHFDAYVYPGTKERPYVTIATVGMSSWPMNVPEGQEDFARCEILLYLERDWDFESSIGMTPVQLLRNLSTFPARYNTWLGYDHSIGAGDEPIVPGSLLTGTYFRAPLELKGFEHMDLPDGSPCHFLWAIPVTDAELYIRSTEGSDALWRFLKDALYITLDPDRECLVSRENRAQRRERKRAQSRRSRLPRKTTARQLQCSMHESRASW